MARNRITIPREEREEEILAIARESFLTDGYRGTTIESIARKADLASNAVLWYFKTKDVLFAAALDTMLDEMQATVEAEATGDSLTDLIAIFATIEPYRPLHGTVSVRMAKSEELRAFYDRVHEWVGDAFLEAARPHFDDSIDRDLLRELIHVVIDGHPSNPREGKPFSEVVGFLLSRVLRASPNPTPPAD